MTQTFTFKWCNTNKKTRAIKQTPIPTPTSTKPLSGGQFRSMQTIIRKKPGSGCGCGKK